jgi:hypothetical protein
MTITEFQLPEQAQTTFSRSTIDDLRRNLYAVDCQLCGTFLGSDVPAATVHELGSFLSVLLHHPACSAPQWIRPHIIMNSAHLLSYRLLDMQVRWTVLGGPADGGEVDLPAVVVNPSLEAVYLDRDQAGDWKVDTVDRYVGRGLQPGDRALSLTAVPDSTVRIGEATHGRELAMTVQLNNGEGWSWTPHPVVAADVRRHRGILLAVTTAVDPLTFDTSRLGEQFQDLMESGDCAAGWIPLGAAM